MLKKIFVTSDSVTTIATYMKATSNTDTNFNDSVRKQILNHAHLYAIISQCVELQQIFQL